MALTGGDDWSITSAGTAIFTKFAGSGLSDCDAATSAKLLWDSTNQTFSCGTDNSFAQSKTFYDATQDTSVSWTVAADVWDGTQPNITLTNTNNRVLVSFTANIVSDDAVDEQAAIQVRRAIGESATCSSTAVGESLLGTFITSANQEQSLSGTFLDTGSFTASDVANYTICTAGHANSLDDGTVLSLTMTLVEVGPAGADLAEVYYSDQSIVPGEVVSLDPSRPAGVVKSTQAYDATVLGIVSTQPGFVLGSSEIFPGKPVLVALSGRVPVKISTENGPILPGDLLTSSSISGVAMKAKSPGFVIGQAMTGYSGSDIGSVMVFVKNHWYDPDTTLVALNDFHLSPKHATSGALFDLTNNIGETVSRVGAFAQIAVGNIQVGAAKVQTLSVATSMHVQENIVAGALAVGEITTDSLTVTTENISIGELTLREYIAWIAQDVITNNKANISQEETIAVAGLVPEESGENLLKQLLDKHVLGASTSAVIISNNEAILDNNQSASSPNLSEDSRDDELILESLRVRENLLIEGILTVIDTLLTKNLVVSGLATFFDAVVFKKDVLFAGRPTFNNDTAGFAVIKKGADRAEIVFDKPYEQLPVVNAGVSLNEVENDIDGTKDLKLRRIEEAVLGSEVSYIVTKRSTRGFTIVLKQPAVEDITFSWTAFSVTNAQTFESSAASFLLLSPTPVASGPTSRPGDEQPVAEAGELGPLEGDPASPDGLLGAREEVMEHE